MRWLSAQPYRISNAELDYAPFVLVRRAPILASYAEGGKEEATNPETDVRRE